MRTKGQIDRAAHDQVDRQKQQRAPIERRQQDVEEQRHGRRDVVDRPPRQLERERGVGRAR